MVKAIRTKHGIAPETIPLAWLLKHPVGIFPIEEWYRLYIFTSPDEAIACYDQQSVIIC
jgi:hypothetical protein